MNIPLQKKFSISYFRENVLRKMLLVPYKKWNKCCSSLLLAFTFESLMNNCKVHGAAMNSSPSTCTLWTRNLLLDSEVIDAGDIVYASPEENAHAQKVLTRLPSLKALHMMGLCVSSQWGSAGSQQLLTRDLTQGTLELKLRAWGHKINFMQDVNKKLYFYINRIHIMHLLWK